MGEQGGDSAWVWRVEGPALLAAYVIPAVVGVNAVIGWAGWVLSPAVETAWSAGLWTGFAVGVAVFFWWTILRTRLEVGPGGVVAVNPWGTHRFRLDEVVSVRLGARGAEFVRADGFTITAYAMSELAAGTSQERRFKDLMAAVGPDLDPAPR